MTLSEVSTAAEGIISTVGTAQGVYFSANGSYEKTADSHDTVPLATNTIPTNDHYNVGAIPFLFQANPIRRDDVDGWFLYLETISGGVLYWRTLSGVGPVYDSEWMQSFIKV